MEDGSDRSPFIFFTLLALFLVSISFLDGEFINGAESVVIAWAGIYLLASTFVLMTIFLFYGWHKDHNKRNYLQLAAWVVLGASCFALSAFSGVPWLWFPIGVGAIFQAKRSLKYYA